MKCRSRETPGDTRNTRNTRKGKQSQEKEIQEIQEIQEMQEMQLPETQEIQEMQDMQSFEKEIRPRRHPTHHLQSRQPVCRVHSYVVLLLVTTTAIMATAIYCYYDY